jgi:hypothetical protein
MDSITPYITVVITILGVAYPILLQVTSRLDGKYSSDHILELFYSEPESKIFKYSLIAALCFIFLWSLKLKPLIEIDSLSFFIDNSAFILVVCSTIFLIFVFFFLIRKIIIYYIPSMMVMYFIKKHKSNSQGFKYVEALGDMLYQYIRTPQGNISRTLSNFFYSVFNEEREKSLNKPVEYPDLFYNIVYYCIEELINSQRKKNQIFEHHIAGELWMLGEGQKHEISRKTYGNIWHGLLLIIHYKRDDLILNYWENAHNYFIKSIPYIYEEFDEDDLTFTRVLNEEEINKRKEERERFIEFHYAIGGLLLYERRYNCLNRLFNFTNNYPPVYEMLPETMTEIFRFYNDIRDPYFRKHPFISSVYPFPNHKGLNADSVVKKWIKSYMAVLFLRQYTIQPHLITMRPLDMPIFPDNRGEIKFWIEGLDFFKREVSAHLANKKLLSSLNFNFILSQSTEEQSNLEPLVFIDNLKQSLEKQYEEVVVSTSISKIKKLRFYASTRTTIEDTLNSFMKISNQSINDSETNSWYISGLNMKQDKDSFSEKPEIPNLNYDSFLGNALSRRINDGIASTFFFKKTRAYIVKPEKIFEAIDRLKVDSNYVIVCFGVFLDYYIKQLSINGLTQSEYKGISIHCFSGSNHVSQSFFILKKDDLPNIKDIPTQDKYISKYSLDKVSRKFDLHASVVDLKSASEEILNENRKDPSDYEIMKSVLLNIHLDLEIKWKNKIDMVQIVEYSEYKQKGLESNLRDIIPFGLE